MPVPVCTAIISITLTTRNPAIIRNKLKINAAVNNARSFLDIQTKFDSFYQYAWQFVNGRQKVNTFTYVDQLPATSKEFDAFSKDLKQRGVQVVRR